MTFRPVHVRGGPGTKFSPNKSKGTIFPFIIYCYICGPERWSLESLAQLSVEILLSFPPRPAAMHILHTHTRSTSSAYTLRTAEKIKSPMLWPRADRREGSSGRTRTGGRTTREMERYAGEKEEMKDLNCFGREGGRERGGKMDGRTDSQSAVGNAGPSSGQTERDGEKDGRIHSTMQREYCLSMCLGTRSQNMCGSARRLLSDQHKCS